MASTLTKRELSEEILFGSAEAKAREQLVKTARHSPAQHPAGLNVVSLPEFHRDELSNRRPIVEPVAPPTVPGRSTRTAPLTVRINRILQTVLFGMCGLAVLGYGLDVAVTHDVTRQQEQGRRLSEENSELSAKLLKTVAYDSLQQSCPARQGLQLPEQVVIAPETAVPKAKAFKPSRHHLPIMSGY
jgi:hypothetical protein